MPNITSQPKPYYIEKKNLSISLSPVQYILLAAEGPIQQFIMLRDKSRGEEARNTTYA